MSPQFVHIVNTVLVSRLVYLGKDGPLPAGRFILMLLIQLAGLLVLQLGTVWIILAICLLAVALGSQLLERRREAIEEWRLLSLLVTIAFLSVFFSPLVNLQFSQSATRLLAELGDYSVVLAPLGSPSWSVWGPILMGLLLSANEANYLVRLLLRILGLSPQGSQATPQAGSIDAQEYNTGRVIGLLERILVYLAVLTGQVAAIGLVLAAKGFTRYREMDEKRFAEYVLIGTFLSCLLAIAAGLFVHALLG